MRRDTEELKNGPSACFNQESNAWQLLLLDHKRSAQDHWTAKLRSFSLCTVRRTTGSCHKVCYSYDIGSCKTDCLYITILLRVIIFVLNIPYAHQSSLPWLSKDPKTKCPPFFDVLSATSGTWPFENIPALKKSNLEMFWCARSFLFYFKFVRFFWFFSFSDWKKLSKNLTKIW